MRRTEEKEPIPIQVCQQYAVVLSLGNFQALLKNELWCIATLINEKLKGKNLSLKVVCSNSNSKNF